MTWLSSIFASKTAPSPITSKNITQLLGLINDLHKYLTKRLYQPNADILKLHFLDRSNTQNARHATLTVQQFFNDTKDQLETYKTVISNIVINPNDRFYDHIKTETLPIIEHLIEQCQWYSRNASFYATYEHDGTLKRFLNDILKNNLATLESLSEPN